MATPPSSMPPSYMQAAQEFPLSYVDFIPALIKPGGVLKSPTYERFGDLMKKANNWLQANPTIRVKTCESLEVRMDQQQINTDVATSINYQSMQSYVRCLRIWITSKTAADMAEPQQIGYLNVVPACKDAGGFLTMPTFDTFGETVDKLNAMLSTRPLPGTSTVFNSVILSSAQPLPSTSTGFNLIILSSAQPLPSTSTGFNLIILSSTQPLPGTSTGFNSVILGSVQPLPDTSTGFNSVILSSVQPLPGTSTGFNSIILSSI
ncbi:hypothetical protein LSAT2_002699 [Lamellibrachia satsuma]|nr:hypothetical protein LSAT2_002699 [Lamellibrachia satsuma]